MTGLPTSQPHSQSLPGTTFKVWQTGLLRSAGFPAAIVLELAAPDSVAAADYLLEQGRPAPDKSAAPQARSPLQRTIEEDERRVRAFLRRLAADPRFQEAVIWQNREFYVSGVTPFLAYPVEQSNQTVRRKERTIARYLQRYCTKNDSIGFFGPLGWFRLTPSGPALAVSADRQLVAARSVYFEHWTIDAVAQALFDPAQRPWLAPRRLPLCRIIGDSLVFPTVAALTRTGHVPSLAADPVALSAAERRLLLACDGTTSAATLADALIGDLPSCFRDREQVFAALERLETLGAIRWRLEAPMGLHPEHAVRAQLARVDDRAVREHALGRLDQIERARLGVAAAAGNPALLNERMSALQSEFELLTGRPASRSPGQAYAARTLVYEDCRRAADVTVGPDVLRRLAPLELLLDAGRWFSYELGRAFRERLLEVYRILARDAGDRAVELADLTARTYDLLNNPECGPLATVTTEFQRRWADVLAIRGNEHNVCLELEALRGAAKANFSAPHAGWSAARYMCPDIMIAGRSAESVARGDYRLVLGEFHLMHTVSLSCMLSQHPDPQKLLNARAAELPQPLVIPLPAKARNTQRTVFSLIGPNDLSFEYSADPSTAPPGRTLPIAELLIIETGDGLRVRSRHDTRDFDIIEFFGQTISNHVALNLPPLLPPAAYTPRLTIDDMVVARETWRVDASSLTFSRLTDSTARFVAVREWARAAGLPRWVFVRPQPDAKPDFVDFASPLLIDLFCKWVRDAASSGQTPLVITEMLPTFEDLWLHDAEGRRYTSELRLVIFDPVPT